MRASVTRPEDLGEPELRRWREFQTDRREWQNPFVSSAFARAVGVVSDQARVAVVEDGATVVGFLPFELRSRRVAVPIGRKLSNRQAFVHAPGLEWTWTDLLAAVGVDVVAFGDLAGTQVESRRSLASHPSPVIDTAGGWDGYLGQVRARKHAKTTLYKERKLRREHADVAFESGPAKDFAALHQLIAWKSAQYRRSGWPDLFARRGVTELLHLLATGSDQEDLRAVASSLRVDGRIIATDLSLASETVFAGWFGAHDLEYSRYSPGSIRTLRTIEAAFDLGVDAIDLARGDETYKHTLKTGDEQVATGYVARPSRHAFAYELVHVPASRVRSFVLEHDPVRTFVRDALARVGAARESLTHRARVSPAGRGA